MNMGMAPRPDNEELRAQTVVKTGLIDAPNPDLFQIYCDLAKDITGFDTATFSLYDGEMKCSIAEAGSDDFVAGAKSERHEFNVCSYVLLDTEPLIMEDMVQDPTWKDHPHLKGLEKGPGYAGFPVINSENFALGTLCMLNPSGPKGLNDEQITQVKKITSSIAHMLDLQIKEGTHLATHAGRAGTLPESRQGLRPQRLQDLCVALLRDECIDRGCRGNRQVGLAEIDDAGRVQMTESGRRLQFDMNLQQKAMKRIKMDGGEADALLEEMFAEID